MAEASVQLTKTGVGVGTPAYMSPEQGQGITVDTRSDVYSLGVMLFEMLTGRVPYDAETPMAIVIKHITAPLPSPREMNPAIPEPAERVILKALAKDPADRFQSVGQMVEALRKAMAVAPVAAEVAPPPPPVVVAEEKPIEAAPLPEAEVAPPPLVEPVTVLEEEAVSFWRKVPVWAWGAVGGVILLAVVGGVLLAGRGPKATPTPAPVAERATTPAATVAPTATPAPVVVLTATSHPTNTPIPATPTTMPSTDTPTPSAPPGMVYVPAGEFTMGSTDAEVDSALALCNEYRSDCKRSWFEDEQPVHTVYLDTFYIDKTEVTNDEFQRFVQATGYRTQAEKDGYGWAWNGREVEKIEGADWRHHQGLHSGIEGRMDHPVVQVSWNDAVAYCQWADKRLPTEAEWEKAARGTDRRTYPWGNTFDGSKLNFCDKNCSSDGKDASVDDGYADTAPVGSYPAGASPYRALDMAGNVWEWWRTGTIATTTAAPPPGTPRGRIRGNTGCCAAARGSTTNYSSAPPIASSSSRRTPTTSLVFAAPRSDFSPPFLTAVFWILFRGVWGGVERGSAE